MLAIVKVNLKIRERGSMTGDISLAAEFFSWFSKNLVTIGPYHHETVITPESRVSGRFVGLRFS
jgi:hypothetical protein